MYHYVCMIGKGEESMINRKKSMTLNIIISSIKNIY